jgi:3-dehydroquinate synthase
MKKKSITLSLSGQARHTYKIWIGFDLLEKITDFFPQQLSYQKIVVITDHTVKKCYAKKLQMSLEKVADTVLVFSFPQGECSKTIVTKAMLEQKMFRKHCGRDTLILALGGGVVGDLAGFVAATYMRGVPYIQIPTTLLAMLDSSVGGKTGINSPAGKNLIGAFWQPQAVIADLSVLRSLPKKHMQNGLFEALKIFLTCDKKYFYLCAKKIALLLQCDERMLKNIILRSVQLKAQIVMQDEQEKNLRMILNFGHTIGHALEKLSDYKMLHGFAVGLGIIVEAKVAVLLGFLAETAFDDICVVMQKLGAQIADLKKFSIPEIIRATKIDKKNKHNGVQYVLLNAIGSVVHRDGCCTQPVSAEVLRSALSMLQA